MGVQEGKHVNTIFLVSYVTFYPIDANNRDKISKKRKNWRRSCWPSGVHLTLFLFFSFLPFLFYRVLYVFFLPTLEGKGGRMCKPPCFAGLFASLLVCGSGSAPFPNFALFSRRSSPGKVYSATSPKAALGMVLSCASNDE